jgi:hypothetical protein
MRNFNKIEDGILATHGFDQQNGAFKLSLIHRDANVQIGQDGRI